jgi:myo-inositol-1(or 4)-monophosphatase
VVIASEAGGKCYGRNGVPFKEDGQALMGRHFLVIRAIGDTPEEKGSDAQDRLAKTFFQTVEEWDA